MRLSGQLLLILCMFPVLVRGQEPAPASIEGSVRDSINGWPLVDARVSAKWGRYSRVPTDSAGRFVLGGIRPGEVEFELHCPSKTMLGDQLLMRRFRIGAGETLVINVLVDASLCDEPPTSTRVGVFRGAYSWGFEHSRLQVCSEPALGIEPGPHPGLMSDLRVWVQLPIPGAKHIEWERLKQQSTNVYFRARGALSGPGKYGHMGVSDYKLVVDSILTVLPWSGEGCLW